LTAGIMKEEEIRKNIDIARGEWRRARDSKLSRKRELLAGVADGAAARRDRTYRDLRKEQRRCTVAIRHLERRLNRNRAREKNEL
jgi:hypothetical protein